MKAHFRKYLAGESKPKPKKGRAIVRCRECWKDVARIRKDAPVPPCPLCGKAETTYIHAFANAGGGGF